MNPSADRERDLFLDALELPTGAAREAFLLEACDGDPALLAAVRRLLAAHDGAGGFLGGPSGSAPAPEAAGERSTEVGSAGIRGAGMEEAAGEAIGRYRLLERVGEGGFGVVWMAEQREPVKRRVALKVIKVGMDTRQVVARFEAERQALALMDHPHIARVLDAGATDTGRPYFVMELVKGRPITAHCDALRLGLRARLELFVEVCGAVQHAHQKGIIHRDLKPSNVLVADQGDRPVPKVIDFGIAKATQQPLTGATVFTRGHELLGTPAYMSPEQAGGSGLDVDTRADIYSLGVLLYELLTGLTPFAGDATPGLPGGYDAIRRRILEEDPVRPSTRVAALDRPQRETTARSRDCEPGSLPARLRGDLDWIVLKCLEKERGRRYESASALANDVRRHLRNEPVAAAAPGAGYRLRKFARRHAPALAASGAFLALIVAGAVLSVSLAVRARRAERAARAEAEVSQAVTRFLTEDLLAQADPGVEPDRELRLRTLLDRASRQITTRFATQTNVASALHFTIGRAYVGLGEYALAEPHVRRTYDLRRAMLGERHPETILALSDIALLDGRRGEDDASCREIDGAVALADQVLGPRHPVTVQCRARQAQIRLAAGNAAGAHEAATEVVAAHRNGHAADRKDLGRALLILARTRGRQGEVAGGEQSLREGLEVLASELGASHPETLAARNSLGAYLYDHRIKLDEAERVYLDGLVDARRTLGDSHLRAQNFRWNLMLLYRYGVPGRRLDALPHVIELIALARPEPKPEHLAYLRWFLDESPPGDVPVLAHLAPDAWWAWVARTNPPSGSWKSPGSSTAGWQLVDRVPGSEVWLRQSFALNRVPTNKVYAVVRSPGDIELFVNGVPVAAKRMTRLDRFQVAVLDDAGRAALRLGTNVAAVAGRGCVPGELIDVFLGTAPPP